MEFAVDELLKFGVAGGLILFTLIRLFNYLEKRDAVRAQDSGIDREEAVRQQREIFDRYLNLLERQSVILDRISARLEDHIAEARREWDKRK